MLLDIYEFYKEDQEEEIIEKKSGHLKVYA